MKRGRMLVLAGVLAATATAVAVAAPGANRGPSSSADPYVVRSVPGVVTTSVLTVGDSVNAGPNGSPYRMVGIPDGLGTYDNGDGTFTVLLNHEIGATSGVVRAHGAKGAFVSKWTVRTDDLKVLHGEDLIQRVATWNPAGATYSALAKGIAIGRLCSADLPDLGAFWNASTGKGYPGRIFMNGEETGSEGRAFANLLDGSTYELPYLGKFSWENSVAHPAAGDTTVVVGLDDSSPGQVYVYVGAKKSAGNAVEKAGLTGGRLYGVKVAGVAAETNAGIAGGTAFGLEPVGADGLVQSRTGAQIQADSVTDGITEFLRPEDGAWDPQNLNDFYFVTTNDINSPSRLYRLRFVDARQPQLGGTLTAVLDGSEGQRMLDNLTIDEGTVLLQEDPGSRAPAGQSNYLARLWAYDIAADKLVKIAKHDPAQFTPGLVGFLTTDEESSGIVPAPFLGRGKYLIDVQAHYALADPELVQGGQLLVLHVPPGKVLGGKNG